MLPIVCCHYSAWLEVGHLSENDIGYHIFRVADQYVQLFVVETSYPKAPSVYNHQVIKMNRK